MKVYEVITESLASKGAKFLIDLLRAGKKKPEVVTTGDHYIAKVREVNFKGKRLYATEKQAEQLDSLSGAYADLSAMVRRLESQGKSTYPWRSDLEKVEQAIQDLMKEISKNKKMDVVK